MPPLVAAKSLRRRCRGWLGLVGLADGRGGRGGGGPEVRRRGRARAELDDPEAQDAVRDLQRVVELLEQRVVPVELEQVVVGVRALLHLVDRRANAPVVPSDDLPALLDVGLDVVEQLVAALFIRQRVEQEDEVVERGLVGHAAVDASNAGASARHAPPTPGHASAVGQRRPGGGRAGHPRRRGGLAPPGTRAPAAPGRRGDPAGLAEAAEGARSAPGGAAGGEAAGGEAAGGEAAGGAETACGEAAGGEAAGGEAAARAGAGRDRDSEDAATVARRRAARAGAAGDDDTSTPA